MALAHEEVARIGRDGKRSLCQPEEFGVHGAQRLPQVRLAQSERKQTDASRLIECNGLPLPGRNNIEFRHPPGDSMRKSTLPLLMCSLLSATAWAGPQMKPGLWEMTMKSDAMKNMNMPRLPPEQVEQMRKMGVEIPHMQDGGMVTRVCMTKQMLEGNQVPGMEKNEAGCQTKNMQQSGGSYSADIVCNGDMKGEGKIKGTFSGDTGFTSTYDFKGTMHGQPVSQRHESSGKWLGADCGSFAPAKPKK
ncbi:DUF3617 domain-containing protein [Herbaspirillum sp. HC18]|nr:DUF3617 domain-containing protein [Herbaspirillum sp. HC18]